MRRKTVTLAEKYNQASNYASLLKLFTICLQSNLLIWTLSFYAGMCHTFIDKDYILPLSSKSYIVNFSSSMTCTWPFVGLVSVNQSSNFFFKDVINSVAVKKISLVWFVGRSILISFKNERSMPLKYHWSTQRLKSVSFITSKVRRKNYHYNLGTGWRRPARELMYAKSYAW